MKDGGEALRNTLTLKLLDSQSLPSPQTMAFMDSLSKGCPESTICQMLVASPGSGPRVLEPSPEWSRGQWSQGTEGCPNKPQHHLTHFPEFS